MALELIDMNQQGAQRTREPETKTSGTARRVHEAMVDTQSNESFLNQLREMVAGPFQRVSEARFVEVLEIVADQDDYAKGKISAIEARLAELANESSLTRTRTVEIIDMIESLVTKIARDKEQSEHAFSASLRQLRDEFESRASSISDGLEKTFKQSETDMRRAVIGLSDRVQANHGETLHLIEQASASSAKSLEARIAQWRAEIDDYRRQDMGEVASSLMEIGNRLLSQRAPSH